MKNFVVRKYSSIPNNAAPISYNQKTYEDYLKIKATENIQSAQNSFNGQVSSPQTIV